MEFKYFAHEETFQVVEILKFPTVTFLKETPINLGGVSKRLTDAYTN